MLSPLTAWSCSVSEHISSSSCYPWMLWFSFHSQDFKVANSRAAWLTDGLIKLFLISLKSSPADSYYHNELSGFCFKSSPRRLFERSHQRSMEDTSCCWKVTGQNRRRHPHIPERDAETLTVFSQIVQLLATNLIFISASNEWICLCSLLLFML